MLLRKEGKGVKMKISFTLDEDRVIVTLVGKATTSDFKAQKDELDSAVEKWSDKEWVINCKDLLYIPSSGLRWLLSIQKRVQVVFGQKGNAQDLCKWLRTDRLRRKR